MIIDMQPDPPYFLLGYSAGALILYPITMELQKRGKQVSKLILLDAVWANAKATPLLEIRKILNEIASQTDWEFLKEQILQQIEDYSLVINAIKFDDAINADIDLLISNETQNMINNNELVAKMVAGMKDYTSGSFHIYSLAGDHVEVLSHGFLDQYAKVIGEILV
jgi:iturin family lipopeptide synthetase B/iturin family lipopeptide synthetase C